MLKINNSNQSLTGTKAETLQSLSHYPFNIPQVYFFTVTEWNENENKIIDHILSKYDCKMLAIRSSAKAEDTANSSMAGAFKSILNVDLDKESINKAVVLVINAFDDNPFNQILIQPMVENVAMSGVIMTHVLDDGSPYHVVNYDDSTGLTDTVTSGSKINKTVYIYNGVDKDDFDSPYLLIVLGLIHDLQEALPDIPLDIEFTIDKSLKIHLLQVRKITTINKWKKDVNDQVSDRMLHLKDYLKQLMQKRPNIFGDKTLLGFMPDWNPAEMIGVVPHPLAMSLYRELITKRIWSLAREKMGYRQMPNVELMISLFGRAYIDVRNSINSFIPAGLSDDISIKVANAYINRLDRFPFLHDKLEFDVVHTAYDFDFDKKFEERYPGVLSKGEKLEYRGALRNITKLALGSSYSSSLNKAIRDIEKLKTLQKKKYEIGKNSFSIADRISSLIDECQNFGTLPFSIIARHGFIAENLLRSAITNNAVSSDRIKEFKCSFGTISGEMSQDFQKVLNNNLTKEKYLLKYGHLRPGSYDILSLNYNNRKDLFEGKLRKQMPDNIDFILTEKEILSINILLREHGFDRVKANDIFDYAKKAIIGREYAKFVFTKHLSDIIENIASWGELQGFSREELAMLTINDVLSILLAPLTKDKKSFYIKKIKKAKNNYSVAASFKLNYLIRSVRDIHIVPMQRNTPNFIGNKRVEADVVELTPYLKNIPVLDNKIVCIEGADPGYDWIFTRNISGLITKYGGANSHMAIRCSEYNLPAAIGCGEQPFNRVVLAKKCLLDCQRKKIEPIQV
jgi:glutamine kinase